jgi:hypothetical protein
LPAVDWHVAQVNIGRLRAPIDDPSIADFVDALDRINALADRSRGFVWRLQSEIGNATDIQPTEDELVIINISVWESVEALADFVYRSDHTAVLRRRREWFERYGRAYTALWWIAAGRLPTIAEALDRLERIAADGPTPQAFTFSTRFAPPPPPPPPSDDLGVDGLDIETVDTQITG